MIKKIDDRQIKHQFNTKMLKNNIKLAKLVNISLNFIKFNNIAFL